MEKKKAKARAAREYEAAARKVEADLKREQAKKQRLAQRRSGEAQLRENAEQGAAAKSERAAAQAQNDVERERSVMLRDAQRRQSVAERARRQLTADERRQLTERRIAEAEFRTEALRRQVDGYATLLLHRTRDLATRAPAINDAFRETASESLVAAGPAERRHHPGSARFAVSRIEFLFGQ